MGDNWPAYVAESEAVLQFTPNTNVPEPLRYAMSPPHAEATSPHWKTSWLPEATLSGVVTRVET